MRKPVRRSDHLIERGTLVADDERGQLLAQSKSAIDRSVADIIRAGLKDMGARNVDNGKGVGDDKYADRDEKARWSEDDQTLKINVAEFRKASLSEQIGRIGHELSHEVQGEAQMITDRTTMANERNGYFNQAVIEHLLGPTTLWDRNRDGPNWDRIEYGAYKSCTSELLQEQWYLCQ